MGMELGDALSSPALLPSSSFWNPGRGRNDGGLTARFPPCQRSWQQPIRWFLPVFPHTHTHSLVLLTTRCPGEGGPGCVNAGSEDKLCLCFSTNRRGPEEPIPDAAKGRRGAGMGGGEGLALFFVPSIGPVAKTWGGGEGQPDPAALLAGPRVLGSPWRETQAAPTPQSLSAQGGTRGGRWGTPHLLVPSMIILRHLLKTSSKEAVSWEF